VFESVYDRRRPDKFGAVDHAICGGTDRALVDELVEGRAGNAELAGGVGFGESGHGRAS
jgi:hypothetical protein